MNDDELRTRFHELRQAERRLAPPFRVGTRARRRVAWRRLAFAALLLLSIGIDTRRREVFTPADHLAARTIAAWSAPTDSLLQTPGRELLSGLPKGLLP